VIEQGKVRGPIVTTRSKFDKAVGEQYPRACLILGQPDFDGASFPKYGAIGTFGLQGLPESLKTDLEMLPANGDYNFASGRIYNLEASKFICKDAGAAGAHRDIAGPEVAHAIWQAAFA
jgi:hypothetical protein